jgi:hypothetical protein
MKIPAPWLIIFVALLFLYFGGMAAYRLFGSLENVEFTDSKGVITKLLPVVVPKSHNINCMDPIALFFIPVGIGLLRRRENSRNTGLLLLALQGIYPVVLISLAISLLFGMRLTMKDGRELSQELQFAEIWLAVLWSLFLPGLLAYILTRPTVKAEFVTEVSAKQ